MLLVQGEFTADAEEGSIRTLLGWRPAGMILQSFVQSDVARSLLKPAASRWSRFRRSGAARRWTWQSGSPTSKLRTR